MHRSNFSMHGGSIKKVKEYKHAHTRLKTQLNSLHCWKDLWELPCRSCCRYRTTDLPLQSHTAHTSVSLEHFQHSFQSFRTKLWKQICNRDTRCFSIWPKPYISLKNNAFILNLMQILTYHKENRPQQNVH